MEISLLFFAIGAQGRWCIYQLDVKTTFLNGELKKEVYFVQPKGFIIKGKEEQVYKLQKALYGLHQTSKLGTVASISTYTKCGLNEISMNPLPTRSSKVA